MPCQATVAVIVRRSVRATSSFLSAPIAWPTKIAPAEAIAKAGMNDTELICMTAMVAASSVLPSPAITTSTKMRKAPSSTNQLSPTGTPKRSVRQSSARRMRPAETFGAPKPTTKQPKRNRNAISVASVDARPAPATPIAGAPSLP